MLRSFVLACLVIAALPRGAAANGRPPATSSIVFRAGHEADIAVGLTWGLLISHDGGATWGWQCEDAVGYSGTYDPIYVFSAGGALFASTFNGFKVERDGCTFGPTGTTEPFASAATVGPDRLLYYGAAQAADPAHGVAADYTIYRSSDAEDGVFTATAGQPAGPVDWWESIAVAPFDPTLIYLSGYVYREDTPGAPKRRHQLLYRSDNAGQDWTALVIEQTNVTVMTNSSIDIVGIAPDGHVYIRVKVDDNIMSDSLYVSVDQGATWQPILHKPTAITAFTVRAAQNAQGHHDLIAGTVSAVADISHDDGATWTALAGSPHMGCLVENAAGELWACSQNYKTSTTVDTSDGAGVMKTTDPEAGTWTKVLRYEDLTEAVACGAPTTQQATCAPMWCSVCAQLGCTPAASYNCPATDTAPAAAKASGGCCDAGTGGSSTLALGLSVGMVLLRPRRRRES
jgi:uncharacterized protein (TIGR03382 family)